MREQQQNETHTITESIIFHMVPGILAGVFYFLVREPLQKIGYPSIFALTLSVAFVIVPVEMGYLLYKGKQKNGRYTLEGVISYRNPMPIWQYILWSLVVLVVVGLIFTALKPLDVFLKEKLFFWVPNLENGLDGNYSKTNLIITYATMLVFGVIIGPLVEELYFRGYLLPRMKGKLPGIKHSFLFAAYHVFTPWMIVTRTIGLLPIIYAVKKKSIYIGIIVHIIVNLIDAVIGIAFIASMA